MVHIKSLIANFLDIPIMNFHSFQIELSINDVTVEGKISKCWTSSQDVLEPFWRWLSGVLRVTGYRRSLDAQSRDIALRFIWDIIYGRLRQIYFRYIIFRHNLIRVHWNAETKSQQQKEKKIKFRSTQKSLL
jgi:hypothetical protein